MTGQDNDLTAGMAPPGPSDPKRLDDLWLPIGPTSVLGGQTEDRQNITGRVRQLAISRGGTRIYAATAGGGVWYSSDQGASWMPIGGWVMTADQPQYDSYGNSLTCGSIVVDWDPLDPADADTVYVGTGETNPGRQGIPGGTLAGVGVLRAQSPVGTARADPFAPVWEPEAPELAGAGVYRLAMDPTDAGRIAAAASIGLFLRTQSHGAATWARVTVAPFHDPLWVTDAWWSQAPGSPARLWVAVPYLGVFFSDNAAATFTPVELPGLVAWLTLGGSADGATMYVLGVGPRLWRVTDATAKRVANVPRHLFGEGGDQADAVSAGLPDLPPTANATGDQSHYDMAVAVDPDNANRVVLGGSVVEDSSAALFICGVNDPNGSPALDYSPAADAAGRSPSTSPSFIGYGVHPDVHSAVFARSASGVDLWVTCDGGVFRSRRLDQYSWQARNNGLAVTEPGYLACHPISDAVVVAGTQDNGVLVRSGDTLWRWALGGDGGGVAFDPVQTDRYFAQGIRSSWRSSDEKMTQPVRRPDWPSREKGREDGQSMFYSTPAAVATTNPPGTRIAVGTHRIWASDTFGVTWYTLPTGSDPIKARMDNLQDVKYGDDRKQGPSRDTVLVCRWQGENELFVLFERSVRHITRATSGTWSPWQVITDKTFKCSTYGPSDISGPVLDHLPPVGSWSDMALMPKDGDGHTPLYVACTGLHGTPAMDTLWWYGGGGSGKWYATQLRAAVRAPALAVAVHPTDPTSVYVGTTLGVWSGTFTPPDAGNPPRWDWLPYNSGLPEGAVQDLAIFRAAATDTAPALILLRAAVASRGVWEVDLLGPCDELTYLRAHPSDTRRRFPTELTDPMSNTLTELDLIDPRSNAPTGFDPLQSPDVVVHPAPPVSDQTMPPRPHVFPLNSGARPYDVWTFQTAFRFFDPACRPNGIWSTTFDRAVRAFRGGLAGIDENTWSAVVTQGRVWQDPWGGQFPTELDLAELLMGPDGETPPQKADTRRLRVEVLVHHRGAQPLAPADASVLLLRRALAVGADPTALPISDAWKARTVAALTTTPPPSTGWPDGWVVADPAVVQHPVAPVEAARPQVARFALTFPPTTSPGCHLLLAICSSRTATVSVGRLHGTTVLDLVRGSSHVAARQLQLTALQP